MCCDEHAAVFTVMLNQAEEIVRRCLCGYSPALALQTSNPIKMPPGRGGKSAAGGNVRITTEHVRNLKHDITFIKKAHDLRAVGEGKVQGANTKAAPPRYYCTSVINVDHATQILTWCCQA